MRSVAFPAVLRQTGGKNTNPKQATEYTKSQKPRANPMGPTGLATTFPIARHSRPPPKHFKITCNRFVKTPSDHCSTFLPPEAPLMPRSVGDRFTQHIRLGSAPVQPRHRTHWRFATGNSTWEIGTNSRFTRLSGGARLGPLFSEARRRVSLTGHACRPYVAQNCTPAHQAARRGYGRFYPRRARFRWLYPGPASDSGQGAPRRERSSDPKAWP